MERQMGRDELDIPAPTYRVPAKRRILDLDTSRLAMIAGGFACVLALVLSLWTALSGSRSGQVPVVAADPRPLKVRPENPGGMQTAGQNDDILSGDTRGRPGQIASGPAGNRQLAPAPEAPAPHVLRARQLAAEEAARQAALQPAIPLPQPISLAPPAATPPALPAPSIAAPAPLAARSGTTTGKTLVQLAAVGTEQAAKAEWQRLSKRMPDILSGRQPVVVKLERDGKTFWRLRTGGFADNAQATAFCDRVKAKGAACSVTVF